MFRVSQHPSSGVLRTVTAASGTDHNIGTATFFQRGQVGTLYSFFNLGARWGGWSTPRPDRFTPGKNPVPIV